MTYARKNLVSLQDTPYYHLIARCVRRAWLWGVDEYAGKDYSHRKSWVLERMSELSSIFTIDICAYAVMSNHYHLVVRVDQMRARKIDAREVIARWTKLFSLPVLLERWEQGVCSDAERDPRSDRAGHAKQVIRRLFPLHNGGALPACFRTRQADRTRPSEPDMPYGPYWMMV